MTSGTLYIVSTPIGHDDDITLRALKVLNTCDIVICEEMKEGATLLRKHKLSKTLEELNEHSDETRVYEIVSMLQDGKNLALISDCGTPIVADPGLGLLNACLTRNIPITVVPGVSSIMTALTRSGFKADTFVSAGFLSRKPEERREQARELARETRTVVLLETPYRLMSILTALADAMPDRNAYIGCNLTYPSETHHYGTFTELLEKFTTNKFRGEFVIVFDGYVRSKSETALESERTRKKSRSKFSKQEEEEIIATTDEEQLDVENQVEDKNYDEGMEDEYDGDEEYDDEDEFDGDEDEDGDEDDEQDGEDGDESEGENGDEDAGSDQKKYIDRADRRPQQRYDNRRGYGDRGGQRSGTGYRDGGDRGGQRSGTGYRDGGGRGGQRSGTGYRDGGERGQRSGTGGYRDGGERGQRSGTGGYRDGGERGQRSGTGGGYRDNRPGYRDNRSGGGDSRSGGGDNRRGDRDNRYGDRRNDQGGRRDFNDRNARGDSRTDRRDSYKQRFKPESEEAAQKRQHGNREGANISSQKNYEGMRPFRPRFDRDDRAKGRGQFTQNDFANNPNRQYKDKDKDEKPYKKKNYKKY